MITDAKVEFAEAMKDSSNLVAIHKDLKQGAGRRVRELSLNRAVVVLTVAAWQAYVQDLAREVLTALEIPSGAQGRRAYQTLRAEVLSAAHNFSTPNADNTRNFLLRLGFDPWPHWTWQEGPVHVQTTEARARMDQWLQVRHAIAHGHDELPDVAVLPSLMGGRRTLHRSAAEACMRFFDRVVARTTAAANEEFGGRDPIHSPSATESGFGFR